MVTTAIPFTAFLARLHSLKAKLEGFDRSKGCGDLRQHISLPNGARCGCMASIDHYDIAAVKTLDGTVAVMLSYASLCIRALTHVPCVWRSDVTSIGFKAGTRHRLRVPEVASSILGKNEKDGNGLEGW